MLNGRDDQALDNIDEIDDWAAAFAAYDARNQGGSQEPEGEPEQSTDGPDESKPADDDSVGGDESGAQVQPGIDAPGTELDGEGHADEGSGPESYSQEEITAEIEQAEKTARSQAIADMVDKFAKDGWRTSKNANGKTVLGATIEDEDICRRDRDGVPVYYNPDTGRPFTGDNPKRQAKEWVEDYNDDLRNKFNEACAAREEELMSTQRPRLETLRFLPTYEKLDPIRQGMFDNLVSDYEVKDEDGDVIGYSCDLDKMLAIVNRQAKHIQEYARKNKPAAPTGPALDMKTSSGVQVGADEPIEFKNLSEAMLYSQNKILEGRKK